ncbi:LiaI-LiaF-like domain-containing protein [Sphingobacterium sp. WOUb80]|uniref:LiaI-LiaF-like domain-containing protein n=1 Tax=Sphingobacterium sp. WOUb80 TaxID=3234028 RepID=UPI003CF2C316
MNTRRITTGITILFIGVVLLLSQLNTISFNWVGIFRYWPLFIVLAGIRMLVPKDQQIGQFVAIGSTVVILGFLTYIGLSTPKEPLLTQLLKNKGVNINIDDPNDKTNYSTEKLTVPLNDKIHSATLNLDLGATSLRNDSSTTSEIFTAFNTSKEYLLGVTVHDESADKLDINLKGKFKNKDFNSKNNNTYIALNPNIRWNLNFDVGAIDANLDLSPYKIETLDIDAGATSLKLKLGQPQAMTKISMDAGASSIEILIPKNAACRITSDNALSSTDYEGDFLKSEGEVKSTNYDSAAQKFDFDINGGIASIKIRRY